MVGNVAVDLYLGRNGIVWCYRSLLGSMLKKITLYISTGDGVVGYGVVCLYWRRCGRLQRCRFVMGTL